MRTIDVPTGKILIMDAQKGKLECLSIGDYGQASNIKADFLGFTNDINGVPNGDIMSLEEKWVITLSTQYGCSMGCSFCDVPLVGPGVNASLKDLWTQFDAAVNAYGNRHTKRLNVHYARMGEPTFNRSVLYHARTLKTDSGIQADTIHPVLTTMMPKKNKFLFEYVREWVGIKNVDYAGEAGLQLSINSTDDDQRDQMFNGSSYCLGTISRFGQLLPPPVGRKYTLNFALADGYEVDGNKLRTLFDPEHWMVKITPIHVTRATTENKIETTGGYDTYTPYHEAEQSCIKAGFDVLVFIPSRDEDEGMITCGNAVLSGREPVGIKKPGEAIAKPG